MVKTYTPSEIRAMKNKINTLSQEEMASLWRFSTSGHPYFRSDLPLFKDFEKRFKKLGGMNCEVSKKIGWGL